jgi:hypothetical protein
MQLANVAYWAISGPGVCGHKARCCDHEADPGKVDRDLHTDGVMNVVKMT